MTRNFAAINSFENLQERRSITPYLRVHIEFPTFHYIDTFLKENDIKRARCGLCVRVRVYLWEVVDRATAITGPSTLVMSRRRK